MATAQKLQSIVNQWTSCADCNDPYPEWADVSRGIIVCLECSGVHRGLGTHVSQIRSLTLDVWHSEWVNQMQESNETFNESYEYHVPSEYMKPTQSSSRDLREKYIIAKYIGTNVTSTDLQPLFHRNHELNTDRDALPPVFDTDSDEASGEAQDDGRDEDDRMEVTKNGTKPWRNYRSMKGGGSGFGGRGRSSSSSGMIANTGVLHIKCINAINLPKGNLNSKKSTYCSFDNGYQCAKTKTIKKDSHPFWNQDLMLSINENECIKIAIYNKNESDELCHSFLDLKDYSQIMQQDKCEMRNYNLIVAKKYRNHKRYTKDGKTIVLNFDVTYNKMSALSDNAHEKRASLILDNTKIAATVREEMEEEQPMQVETNRMELIDEELDDEESIDDDDESESSSTPPPKGVHPGDTVDTFVLYNDDEMNDGEISSNIQRIRLTASMSVNSYINNSKWNTNAANNINDNAEHMMEEELLEESTPQPHLNKVITFTRGECDYVDINGLIDSLKIVVLGPRVHDVETQRIVCECVDQLNEYIFNTERVNADDDDSINGINDTIIDSLREMNNALMSTHAICTHLQDIFVAISDDDKYIEKQYLIHNLQLCAESKASQNQELMFRNLLQSADADNIEYIFNEILRMNDGDSYKLHLVMDLIVDCINNNNIKVKRLSVEILSKFSHDIAIQQCILEYSAEILRFLYLIDIEAFINISYHIMLSVSRSRTALDIYGVHYNTMQKYIAQQLVDDYEPQQYNDDINPILYAIKVAQNEDSNCRIVLSEMKLKKMIHANLAEVAPYGLDENDMLNIAKSKQILNFQTKTQCALMMQNMFRACYQRRAFIQMMRTKNAERDRKEALVRDAGALNKGLMAAQQSNGEIKERMRQQEREIEQLKAVIESLKWQQQQRDTTQKEEMKQEMRIIERLKEENHTMKQKYDQQNEIIKKQAHQIQEAKREHCADKQQFAMQMDGAMNELRRHLKVIGGNQRKLQMAHIDRDTSHTNTNQTTASVSFFPLW